MQRNATLANKVGQELDKIEGRQENGKMDKDFKTWD